MAHGIICIDCSRIVDEVRSARCPACWQAWRGANPRRDGTTPSAKAPTQRRLTHHRAISQGVYRTKQWKRVRQQVLDRDGRVCRICGTPHHLTVHHIVPIVKDQGLAYDPENLATVCRKCHGRLDGGKAAQTRRPRRG